MPSLLYIFLGGPYYGGDPAQLQQQSAAVKITRERCENLFKSLRSHPSIPMFLEPQDIMNPKYNQLQQENLEFINMVQIETNFRQNK